MKRSLFTTLRPSYFIVDQHPQDCHQVQPCSVITYSVNEDPFLAQDHSFLGFSLHKHFYRRNRLRPSTPQQTCHLKATPQGHTRQLNISPPRKHQRNSWFWPANKHRSEPKQIRGQGMLCRHYHTETTIQTSSSYRINHRCPFVHPATSLHICSLFTLLLCASTYPDQLETLFYIFVLLFSF